jgi:hypothetical protein
MGTTIGRKCKTCGYSCGLDNTHLWCHWLGKPRRRNATECEDGYKERD